MTIPHAGCGKERGRSVAGYVQATSLRRATLAGLVAVLPVTVAISGWRTNRTTDAPLLIRGATVVDVVRGNRTPNTSVLVDAGRIIAIGPDGRIAVPAGTTVLEGAGKFLAPGFIDSHAHLFPTWGNNWPDTLAELGWILAHGVTTIRDAGGGGDRARLQESYIRLRAAADSGRIVSPRIVVSGTAEDLLRLTGAATLAAAFADFRNSGLDQFKVMGMPRARALEQIRLARRARVTVYGHHSYRLSDVEFEEFAEAAVTAGINGLSHRAGVRDGVRSYPLSRGVNWSSPPDVRARAWLAEWVEEGRRMDSAAQQAWIKHVVSHGTWLEPTLSVTFAGDPIQYGRCTDPVDLAGIRKFYPYYAETMQLPLTAAQEDTVRLICQDRFRFLRAFYQAGGKILAGTDEVPFPPLGVQWGMSLLVRAGLPPLAALQAATVNSATALDLGRRIGTIEVGKDADLVLLDGDPIQDIQNVFRVSVVIARGRVVDRKTLLAREGTTPPMRSAAKGLESIPVAAAALARQRPDTIVDLSVVVNSLYRPGDLRGLQRWVPAELHGEVADTLIVRGPARVIGSLASLRFVQTILIRQRGR